MGSMLGGFCLFGFLACLPRRSAGLGLTLDLVIRRLVTTSEEDGNSFEIYACLRVCVVFAITLTCHWESRSQWEAIV